LKNQIHHLQEGSGKIKEKIFFNFERENERERDQNASRVRLGRNKSNKKEDCEERFKPHILAERMKLIHRQCKKS